MRRKSAEVSIGIFGINGADSPSTGLILSQCLRRQVSVPVRIIALVTNPFSDGIQAVNHADEVVVVPAPESSPGAFRDRMAEIARRFSPFILLPGEASHWLPVVPMARDLQSVGVSLLFPTERSVRGSLPFPPPDRVGKVSLPKHYVLRSRDLRPLLKIAWHFPLRVRAIDGGSESVFTWEELELKVAQHRLSAAAPLVVQEILSGEELSVAALGDRRGRLVGSVVAKLLSCSENGAVWSAMTVDDGKIMGTVKSLLSKLAWSGPLTLNLVASGSVHLVGLAPGFPSWISLAAAAGQDLPLQYLRLALGTSVLPMDGYRAGLCLARVSVDQPTDVAALSRLVTQGACSNAVNSENELRATAHYATNSRHHR